MDSRDDPAEVAKVTSSQNLHQSPQNNCESIMENGKAFAKQIAPTDLGDLYSKLCDRLREGCILEQKYDINDSWVCEQVLKDEHQQHIVAEGSTNSNIAPHITYRENLDKQVPAIEFKLFPELAQEIKDMVWELILPRHRVIDVQEDWIHNPNYARPATTTEAPTIISICQDSRSYALKMYRSLHKKSYTPTLNKEPGNWKRGRNTSQVIYFDPRTEVIELVHAPGVNYKGNFLRIFYPARYIQALRKLDSFDAIGSVRFTLKKDDILKVAQKARRRMKWRRQGVPLPPAHPDSCHMVPLFSALKICTMVCEEAVSVDMETWQDLVEFTVGDRIRPLGRYIHQSPRRSVDPIIFRLVTPEQTISTYFPCWSDDPLSKYAESRAGSLTYYV